MKKGVFVLTAIIISISVVEIVLGYFLWIRKTGISSTALQTANRIYARLNPGANNNIETSFSPKSMYIPDQYLGYSDLPGSYTVVLRDKTDGRYHRFTATINESGNRITSFSPELFSGKKEIWIFGESYTYGWGNNDETSFPFFLQLFLPNFHIVNFADNGYGNTHAYLQLKKEFENNNTPPKVIVLVYGDYFNERNVASPSRLREYKYNDSAWRINPSKFLHPKAFINNGKLEIEYVPLFWEFNKTSDGKDPSKEYQYEVTKKILREVHSIGKRKGAKLILAFIQGDDSDEIVSHARERGYFISDIRPSDEAKEWDDFSPYDGHPGPLAQNTYARKLYRTISEVLSRNENG